MFNILRGEMIQAGNLISEFDKYGFGPYIEVPCSILGPIIANLINKRPEELINPTNEAIAMGIASGSFMATGKIPVVLMQNSGLCNALNSITSLNQIYDIPILMMISWRGEPGAKDAPEHLVVGERMKQLLEVFDIPYVVLSEDRLKEDIVRLAEIVEEQKRPVALIIRHGLFEKEDIVLPDSPHTMYRDEAINIIIDAGIGKSFFVTTNGFISREAFNDLTGKGEEDKNPLFYMLGSMGHALPVGMGLARGINADKKIIVLDGDGGCLMHSGAMASVNDGNCKNLVHIVLDNSVYGSTGGQPTISGKIDFKKIASGCGYKNVFRFNDPEKMKGELPRILDEDGPTFVHVRVNSVSREAGPRISTKYSCKDIKERFMEKLK